MTSCLDWIGAATAWRQFKHPAGDRLAWIEVGEQEKMKIGKVENRETTLRFRA